MRSSPRRIAGAIVASLGLILSVLAVLAPPASAYEGSCTPAAGDSSSGTCILDETNGSDGSTWGTMSYSRVGDVITFDFDLGAGSGTSLLACFSVSSAYPTSDQPCVGSSNPQYNGAYVDPLVVNLADPPTGNDILDFDPGDPVFFAVHVNQSGRTTYGIGGAGSTPPPTYVCSAATNVGQTTATLNASTTDASVTSAVFTLNPGAIELTDNSGPPWSVNATGLSADTAYTYTVEFDGEHQQSNQACGFTTDEESQCVPTVENNLCNPCPPGEVADGEGGCDTPPEADLSASLACPTQDLDAMVVTINNDGDGPGSADVTSAGELVESVNVPAGESVSVAVPVAEDAAYEIAVTDVELFEGTRDCEEVDPAVIPRDPEPTSEPEPTKTPPEEQVLGNVVRRELPRTGSDSLPLAEAGLVLILLGTALTLTSRRQLRATA